MFTKEKEFFSILFEAVSEGVIVVNTQQNIVATNQSAENMFGYNKKELETAPLIQLIPKNYHHNHHTYVNGFMKKNESRQMGVGRDLFGIKKNGDIFPVEVGLNPFTVSGETFVMALVVDITLRKQHQDQIQELNAKLEQKVIERTKELSEAVNKLKEVNAELDDENKKRLKAENKAKEALKKEKELNELKTKFLSLVSHEFKTPLSGILTSAMLLSKYKLEEQQQRRDKHIKTITDKVHYLNNILNDFLSIEKLERGKIQYNPSQFKISKVVNEVIYNANMMLKDGQIINYPENIDNYSIYQDEKIVELALSNLVYNAIKYSSENTVIDIKIKQNLDSTTFIVEDNGIGIPEKDQKNIFKRYYRAENALLTQGTGIGLNIVKSHLENLKGNIYFNSKENQGTTFWFSLPNKYKTKL
jgi:PAS domain S-box-containing protein